MHLLSTITRSRFGLACLRFCLAIVMFYNASFLFAQGNMVSEVVSYYVDPRIGSEGLGRVFVGPCVPFGMVKPGPDCGVSNNAGWAPSPAKVSGFSQTHVSGTGGGPKYGNILVRPFSGPDQTRKGESIKLGLYRCEFEESGISAEVTASSRTSFYRFVYPEDVKPYVEFDLTHFLGRNPVPKSREAQQFEGSDLKHPSENEWTGWQTISGGWNNGKPYTVYFYACQQRDDDTLLLKIGISYVSEEQAKANCLNDIPHWDFDQTYDECVALWEKLLTRLPLSLYSSRQVKRMYYTALYHMCLMPTEREDGTYDDYYAIWDTYRTSTPLLTLLAPERATAIAQSLLTIYQREGFMPDARSGNSNGRTQGGSNAEIVLADALARGLDIDANLALEAMIKDATVAPEDDEAEGRGGLKEYNQYGYIPYIINDPSTGEYTRIPRAGNRTVEYSFCDWAIAQVAKRVGEDALYEQYMKQSERWKNLWRADYKHKGTTGFIMPRDEQGEWLDSLPYGHSKVRRLLFPYTPDVSYEGPWYCKWWDCFMYEASSWEYSFAIPHDIPGLIELCGGKEAFEARLDKFFENGYYNVANEPSFLTPMLFHWVGKPEKSSALIKRIIEENFSDRPDGLPGNDDGGAMSSWLACHLLGKYPLAGTDQWIEYEPLSESVVIPEPEYEESVNPESSTGKILSQYTHILKFSLHGQTRKFYVKQSSNPQSENIRWTILRNLKWWTGNYKMSRIAMDEGRKLCYVQPLDKQNLTLDDDELFCMVSRKVLKEIRSKGSCDFDCTSWKVVDKTKIALKLIQYHLTSVEGAEMWVNGDPFAPYIVRMKNNPAEIDWEWTRIDE